MDSEGVVYMLASAHHNSSILAGHMCFIHERIKGGQLRISALSHTCERGDIESNIHIKFNLTQPSKLKHYSIGGMGG